MQRLNDIQIPVYVSCSGSSVTIVTIIIIIIPWSRVLPEKLKCPKLLMKFPAFYGTRRFITVYTRVRHLSLS